MLLKSKRPLPSVARCQSELFLWVWEHCARLNFQLPDEQCIFRVGPIKEVPEGVATHLHVQPMAGMFAEIAFHPVLTVYADGLQRPRVYNQRRIYHPNINFMTCQVVFSELVKGWCESEPAQRNSLDLVYLFRSIKYVLMEPDETCVPDTLINRRAAWQSHFKRENYRQLIISNSPLFLDQLAQSYSDTAEDRYWSLKALTARQPISCMDSEQDETVDILEKRISFIRM